MNTEELKADKYSGLRQHSKESNIFVKECLKAAMISLASDMDYADISVTRLCQKAGVSRMAFYRNYSITNDVIYEIAYDLNYAIVDLVGSPFRITTDHEWYEKTFALIGERRNEMTLMFQENFQYQWMRIVNGIAVHDDSFSTEKQFQRIMWAGGFENAVSYWLNSGLEESPSEMADYCIKYLPHLIKEDIPDNP